MDNILEIMMTEKAKEFQASVEFDKEVLREVHEKNLKSVREMGPMQCHCTMGLHPSVRLKGLRPIRARELLVDKQHKRRVLFGTLCVDAYRVAGIMTLLEDQFGDAVRLAIHNTSSNQSPSSLYPKGSRVAVKQPYFTLSAHDGVGFMLLVDNPQNVKILASIAAKPESSLAKDLLELRSEGNKYFRSEDWNKAIGFYSKCIDLALSRHKIEPQGVPSASNIQEKVKENIVCSYSNRAEARIKLKQYGAAVQDCDKALILDRHHLKSLFRKGRAFHCLGEYKLACQCFDRALEQNPSDAKDIQKHYEKSMQLDRQNKQGEFDISPYFTNAGSSPPEFSNYVGPVLIKKSVGRGRGLFATDDVDVGDFLLADNAIALSGTETERFKGVIPGDIDVHEKLGLFKGDLEAQTISCAASSPRVLQQLQFLADLDEMKVPPMNLFRINNASWDNYDHVSNQSWELDETELAKIMLNLGCHVQLIEPNKCLLSQNMKYGLWTLPSFINHSCFHNANCIVVGEAMFVIAARKIEAGEEITIPYFPSTFPLLKREIMCRRIGFKCDCKRCMLERSLVSAKSSPLQEIFELVDSIDLTALPNFERRKIAMRLEKSIDVLSSEEKQVIRASFLELYHDICEVDRIHSYGRTGLPSLWEVLDAFEEVFPGNSQCLELFASLSISTKDELLYDRAFKICRAYMGKHDEGILKFILNSIATDESRPGCTLFGFSKLDS